MLGDFLCLAEHTAPKQGPPAGSGTGWKEAVRGGRNLGKQRRELAFIRHQGLPAMACGTHLFVLFLPRHECLLNEVMAVVMIMVMLVAVMSVLMMMLVVVKVTMMTSG